MIGSLFTLAGETLSAIGRMIERPAFNDEAAEHPVAATEGPNPATPPTGLGHQTSECPGCYDFACPGPHPTSPGASSVSQPAAAAVPGESVGATEQSSGGGADRPLSEVLIEVCDVLRGLTSTPLSMTAWLSYCNDALILMPVLQDAADKLRDTE